MDTLENIFKGMTGQVCWGILHENINLSFNLGEPQLKFESCKDDPARDRKLRQYTTVKGQWFLWVYLAYWTLTVLDESGENKLKAVTSTSDRDKKRILKLLCGQKLTQININSQTGKTRLLFDLGAELEVRRMRPNAEEVWLLYDPNDYCLSINGDGTYSYVPSSGLDTRSRIENAPIQINVTVGENHS